MKKLKPELEVLMIGQILPILEDLMKVFPQQAKKERSFNKIMFSKQN